MTNYYINYNAVRSQAINLLLDLKIDRYPISPAQICKKKSWQLISMAEYASMCNSCESEIKHSLFIGCDAYTFYNMKTSEYKIVYDRQRHFTGRENWTIAHEIGHIVLGHHKTGKAGYKSIIINQSERYELEADYFAGHLLSTPVILNALNVSSPDQIAHICRLSKAASISRKRALDIWRIKGYVSKNELCLLTAFDEYLSEMERFKATLHGEVLGF